MNEDLLNTALVFLEDLDMYKVESVSIDTSDYGNNVKNLTVSVNYSSSLDDVLEYGADHYFVIDADSDFDDMFE